MASPVPASPSPAPGAADAAPRRAPLESPQDLRLRAALDDMRADVQGLRDELVDILVIEKPKSAGGRAELEREVRDAGAALEARPLEAYRERLGRALPADGSAAPRGRGRHGPEVPQRARPRLPLMAARAGRRA